jgi:hypothetical protein
MEKGAEALNPTELTSHGEPHLLAYLDKHEADQMRQIENTVHMEISSLAGHDRRDPSAGAACG